MSTKTDIETADRNKTEYKWKHATDWEKVDVHPELKNIFKQTGGKTMKPEEYEAALKKLKDDFNNAKSELCTKYANSNSPHKKGDIVPITLVK